LLAAVPPERVDDVRAALDEQGVGCWEIGVVEAGSGVVVMA
jgi:phosphoribosylaminoimidazole (AIR) synthetase